MSYILGEKSLKELEGVHPDLVAIVKRTIEITTQDFSVHDGIRTIAEQKELVKSGASKTLNSRHITGHAVDLVPYINGKLRWEWEPIYQIADAVRLVANEMEIPIRWGGAWDVIFTGINDSPEDIVSDYIMRRKNAGKSAFIDGPHYELTISSYPRVTEDDMNIHKLKTDKIPFSLSFSGAKDWEIRKNDRDFKVGDLLILKETVFSGEEMMQGKPLEYTGRELSRLVSHVMPQGMYGTLHDFVIMSVIKI